MTQRKWLSFDIETAKITPDGEDIQKHRPLGICCWAVAWIDSNGIIATFAESGVDVIERAAQMNKHECGELVHRLYSSVNDGGFTLLTHNGVSFDLDILAEESGLHAECAELAMNSVDTILEVFCRRGYPVGLEAIAKGFGLQGKTEGMSGSLAPVMWANGEYDKVLEYVAQDAKATLEVALAIEKHGAIRWISKSGRLNMLPVRRLMTAKEALALPEPNTSWMTGERLTREKFTAWMQKQPS